MIEVYPKLRSFLKKAAGVVLDSDRQYSAAARLSPLLQKFGEPDLNRLILRLDKAEPELERSIVDALMTNETFFFRDRVPFDLVSSVLLPQLKQARQNERTIRIWCAACSTGQEPYSLAMIVDELARELTGWRVEILATDLSRAALKTARAANYNQFEVQRGLPVNQLLRYFSRVGEQWQLAEHLRARVDFREVNLTRDFSSLGKFDIIFCRNVLLYFAKETREDVLARIAVSCRDDGFLVLGATEVVAGNTDAWRSHHRYPSLNVLRRNEHAARLHVVSNS